MRDGDPDSEVRPVIVREPAMATEIMSVVAGSQRGGDLR